MICDRALAAVLSRSVPTRSQTYGHVIHAAVADHVANISAKHEGGDPEARRGLGRKFPTGALATLAALLAFADLAARMTMPPAELPIGILTALIGGPFFLILLMRLRGRIEIW